LEHLAASGTPRRLEQLFGLPFHSVRVARRMDVGVRIYVGYGHAWLPYRMSDGLRRPEVWGWFWRDLRAAWCGTSMVLKNSAPCFSRGSRL
jgi:hypothetical protein